jgi:mannose-6-phosphate isomerase
VGFSRDVGEDELAQLVAAQELDRFLERMNRLPVRPGDSIFVPAGVPHVIGEGILLLELQEPSDLSLLLEWKGMTESEALLGLSRETALRAVDRSAVDLAHLTAVRGRTLFPSEADAFFRAELVGDGARLDAGFSVLVVTDGKGELRAANAKPLRIWRGSTVLVPFAAGTAEVAGTVRAIRCRPPVQ